MYVLFTMFKRGSSISVNSGISSSPHSILIPDVTALATYVVNSTLERCAARVGPGGAVVIAGAVNLQCPIILASKRRDRGWVEPVNIKGIFNGKRTRRHTP